MIKVITQKRIYRSDLQRNPTSLYLFGDNAERIGLGGQAGECRGEPNAHGIATKLSCSEFFSDTAEHMDIIYADFQWLADKVNSRKYDILVIPEDGLGTGLSAMAENCPKLLDFVNLYLNTYLRYAGKDVL